MGDESDDPTSQSGWSALVDRLKGPGGKLIGILAVLSSIITILGFLNIDSDTFNFNSIPILSFLSMAAFLGAGLTMVMWLPSLKRSTFKTKLLIIATIVLTACGVVALLISLIQPNIPGGGGTSDRTLMESIEPTPQKFQVQRDGSTATVSGVEMQAKSCPQETSSFTIKSLEQGDRVSFSLKGFPGDNDSGSYAVTAHGAGISENYRISRGAIQRIQASAQENGDLNITISAQHRPDLGSSCDATNEVLAIEDAVLN